MEIVKPKDTSIAKIINTLKNNGLVIMPTETVYGAFVDATSQVAVKKLTEYKNRPFGKPYSVAVANQTMAEKYVYLNTSAKEIFKNFLPGPVTVVSKGKHLLAAGVESETGTLGIRVPDHKLILNVVKKFGKPLTATSANASYQKRPYKISDILESLSQKQKNLIDLIVDAGTLPKREPSTVIDTTYDDLVILRQGGIKLKDENNVFSRSPENTQNVAKELWQKYEGHYGKRAIVFALVGPMGTGKTVFTKGLGRALGIKEEIVSPTYDLELDYRLPTTDYRLIHIDAWRMLSYSELVDLEFARMITDKSVIAIEWADRVADEIRKYNDEAIIIWIKIEYGKNDNERLISWGVL